MPTRRSYPFAFLSRVSFTARSSCTGCIGLAWLVLGVVGLSSAGDDWPQFRGPGGQGHADARELPVEWSESKNVAWKTSVPGKGWSSPVIAGETIWLTTALDAGQSLRAVAIDRRSGSIAHDIEVARPESPPKINDKNSYASPTPVIDDGRVYVHFGTFGTACLDATTGRQLWRNEELKLNHSEGPGSSPVVHGDLLLVNCDGIDAQYVAAFDKHTGEVVWKTPRSGPFNDDPQQRKAFSTPLVIDVGGTSQLVSPGAERVAAYDPATGQELWHVNYDGFSNVPRPLFAHGLLFVCTGYMRPQLWAIRPGGEGDLTESAVVWRCPKQAPANPSPILVGEELYMVSDAGVLTCLDAQSGSEHWQKRMGGNFSASPLYADRRLYLSSEEGTTHVVEPGRKFKPLASNQLDGRMMASPAAVGRSLFLRTEEHLYRIETTPPTAAGG
ncbi:MAG TPA: PQQ-binding-like beta-propeller repeat protein [Pirellulales bacterium]|nr:PQQ-binding-like beta-propeller repeat protein [Pirellulales bacterium]